MFVLLSDGAGLTGRQCATLLSAAGHRVEALSPAPLCLGRLTRHVRAVHRVPPLGDGPQRWLDAALAVAQARGAELLLPVQEQVAVMSRERARIAAAGLLTAVPGFAALREVQDKVSAFRTLDRLGLPQPCGQVITSPETLKTFDRVPVFVKTPIGTASAGAWRITSRRGLVQLAGQFEANGLDWGSGVLVQQPAAGPLAIASSVFAGGQLVAFHATERVREGAGGGSSHKRGLLLPAARDHLAALGQALNWHGALSADVILTAAGPQFIDLNPRLVEPVNAHRSGPPPTGGR